MTARWLGIVCVTCALGCGSAASEPSPAPSAPPVPSEASPAPAASTATPTSPADSDSEAAAAWPRSAPGRSDASVRVVERRGEGRERTLHVVAQDGDVTLDAWIESLRSERAARFWQVAEIVAAARRGQVDTLLRSGRRTLATIAGRTLLCAGAACRELPTPLRVVDLACGGRGDRRCTLRVRSEPARIEEWEVEGVRRRLVRSWPAEPAELAGPWDAEARSERGAWVALAGTTDRPAVLDDPALAPPTAEALEAAIDADASACVPTVQSFRDGDTIVRTASCGEADPMLGDTWPAAFVITEAGRTRATPLFTPSPSPPAPDRAFAIGDLAGPDALGFVAGGSDGGSPGGHSSDDLWVLVPTAHGLRAHAFELGAVDTIGLGNEDEDEGYVVGVSRARTTFEVVGVGVARIAACERWDGTHSRVSDRWRGGRRVERVDARVTFDTERGFAMDHADRERLSERCAAR